MYSKLIEKIVTDPKYFSLLGFTLVRSVMSQDAVGILRKNLDQLFAVENQERLLLPRHVLKNPTLRKLPFLPKIVRALKEVLEPRYALWGDFVVQKNSFGRWHVDSGSEKLQPYLFEKSYRFVKCGIFLQENSHEWGGGIGVRLFSHKKYNKIPYRLNDILYSPFKKMLEHHVIIHPGDFLCFDSRLEHNSRFPAYIPEAQRKEGYNPLPEEKAKYVFYFNACNQASARDFMENTLRRGFCEEYIKKSEEIFFTDYGSRMFPEDFPKDFIENVRQTNITVASPNQWEADINKIFMEELQKNASHQ